jgi:hypothetical protein
MMPSLRCREYVEAANLAHERARSERNPRAKQMLQEIERSYYRLIEIEKWMVDQQQYNRAFAHFGLFNGRDPRTCFASARTSCPLRQITATKDHKSKGSCGTP